MQQDTKITKTVGEIRKMEALTENDDERVTGVEVTVAMVGYDAHLRAFGGGFGSRCTLHTVVVTPEQAGALHIGQCVVGTLCVATAEEQRAFEDMRVRDREAAIEEERRDEERRAARLGKKRIDG